MLLEASVCGRREGRGESESSLGCLTQKGSAWIGRFEGLEGYIGASREGVAVSSDGESGEVGGILWVFTLHAQRNICTV
jgi:hypothetical protein